MKTWILTGLLGISILSPAAPVFSQPVQLKWRGSGGWGSQSAYCALFDTKTLETVSGTVLSIDAVTPLPGMSAGLQVTLKTDKETIQVHLGPQWYLENQDFNLQDQDTLEIKGSRINCGGARVLAAAEVRKGDQVLRLRDSKGHPLWAGLGPHS